MRANYPLSKTSGAMRHYSLEIFMLEVGPELVGSFREEIEYDQEESRGF